MQNETKALLTLSANSLYNIYNTYGEVSEESGSLAMPLAHTLRSDTRAAIETPNCAFKVAHVKYYSF